MDIDLLLMRIMVSCIAGVLLFIVAAISVSMVNAGAPLFAVVPFASMIFVGFGAGLIMVLRS